MKSPPDNAGAKASPATGLRRRVGRLRHRAGRLNPALRGMLWTMLAGFIFIQLNTFMRVLAIQLDPFQAMFLRYLFGALVMLPLVLRSGLAAYMPNRMGAQVPRAFVHAVALTLWFIAVPFVPVADNTAIGFATPIFVMLGAAAFFHEAMRLDRWLATLIGFAGVLIVVWPKLSGDGGFHHLLMLACCPLFAVSFLMTKAQTRYERTGVIVVWQAILVTLFSIPLAVTHWTAPTMLQWLGFLLCGLLGSAGQLCQTRALAVSDISSTQSIKFLDLIWATFMGWLVFADPPSASTLSGGVVIALATFWIARREARPVRESRAGKSQSGGGENG